MKPRADYRGPDDTTLRLPSDAIDGIRAWKREDLTPDDWALSLPEACLAELDEVARFIRTRPRPVQQLSPAMFALTACADVITKLRHLLTHQTGFAVLDRIPVERYSVIENKAVFWLLASMLGQVVHQKWQGTVLYDVKNFGKSLGYGVRRSVTNLDQDFHTDGGWLRLPPEFVGLFCLHAAQDGGMSRCVSLITVHQEMQQRRDPALLSRLYQPFWWDRQAEHGPDDARCSWHPVYWRNGRTLLARYYEDYIHNGYELAGDRLDTAATEALAALRTIVDAAENRVEFHLARGQLLYLNNRQCAHARTAFTDAPAAAARRHLIRLWNRSEGTPQLEGREV